eukprot:525397-Hanusia_phi.AAC.2
MGGCISSRANGAVVPPSSLPLSPSASLPPPLCPADKVDANSLLLPPAHNQQGTDASRPLNLSAVLCPCLVLLLTACSRRIGCLSHARRSARGLPSVHLALRRGRRAARLEHGRSLRSTC